MTSQRPRRPIPSTSSALAQTAEPPVGIPTQTYADKVKLARHLHAQGINPLLWTKAHPAIHAEQEQFHRTGQKPRENQFEVGGRLYESSPEIVATPAQGRADLSTYLQARGDPDTRGVPPLESYVEIDKVPLQHPMGQAFIFSDTPESKAALRSMIKAGIDPKNAHLGDPLPMPTQERLQQMLKRIPFNIQDLDMPTAGEESEASDLLYRGADGWIYAKNDATREPLDVLKIRARHAEKLAQKVAGSPRAAANENDPEEENEILRHYVAQSDVSHEPAAQTSVANHSSDTAEDLEKIFNQRAIERISRIAEEMPFITAAIEHAQAGGELTEKEQEIVGRLRDSFLAVGLDFDPGKANLDYLRDVAKAIKAATSNAGKGRVPLHVTAQALNVELSQALVGSTMAWAAVSQRGPAEALKRGLLATRRYGPTIRKLAPLATTSMASLRAADIARKWAEEDETPAIISPYADDSDFLSGSRLAATNGDLIAQTHAENNEDASLDRNNKHITALLENLGNLEELTIHIGDIVIRQHPHTTATDQIFIEELISIGQSRGCDPEPDPRPAHRDKQSISGGTDYPQRRITDLSKPGHLGSAQGDATVNWAGKGNSAEIYFNSMTTKANQVDGIAGELASAKRMLDVATKQLGADEYALKKLLNPVRAKGHVFVYGKKWKWELEKIRRHLRRKLEQVFDQFFEDCAPKGPPSIIQLDDVDDIEFNE